MEERHINVHVITGADVANALQDLAVSGVLNVAKAIVDKSYAGDMVLKYFQNINLFNEIIGQPLYVMPDIEEDKD